MQQQQQPRPGASVALIVASNQQSRAAMIATSVAASRRWFGLHPVTGNTYANMHMMLFYYVFVSP